MHAQCRKIIDPMLLAQVMSNFPTKSRINCKIKKCQRILIFLICCCQQSDCQNEFMNTSHSSLPVTGGADRFPIITHTHTHSHTYGEYVYYLFRLYIACGKLVNLVPFKSLAKALQYLRRTAVPHQSTVVAQKLSQTGTSFDSSTYQKQYTIAVP